MKKNTSIMKIIITSNCADPEKVQNNVTWRKLKIYTDQKNLTSQTFLWIRPCMEQHWITKSWWGRKN